MSHSNTPPVRNRAPLTARSSSLICVSAAEHQTAEQYSKTGRTKLRKHLPKSDLSWNTLQNFLKILSLWEAAMETERRCFSKVILESNVTHNITRSSDSFSAVPPIVNRGDWGCIVRDLETIIVLVLLAFNSNWLLIIKLSRFGDKNQDKSRDFNATILTFSGKHYHQFSNVWMLGNMFPQSHCFVTMPVTSRIKDKCSNLSLSNN